MLIFYTFYFDSAISINAHVKMMMMMIFIIVMMIVIIRIMMVMMVTFNLQFS